MKVSYPLSLKVSLWLMLNLPAETWVRFGIWMVAGFGIYFVYGRSHSRLGIRSRQKGQEDKGSTPS